jgi:hypothetical protein
MAAPMPSALAQHRGTGAMSVPAAELTPSAATTSARLPRAAPPASLPTYRVNIMRIGYLILGVGLALTRWPMLGDAASLPVFEGVVTALLTAMSLLAFLGLRYPIALLPILLFESLWKLIWLAAVGIPHVVAGDVDAELGRVLFSVSLVVVILAVTPWDYVWKRYVTAPGDRWR